MKLTMDEMNMLLTALYKHSVDLTKVADAADRDDKPMTAKLFAEQADRANALRDKLIANLDEMTI